VEDGKNADTADANNDKNSKWVVVATFMMMMMMIMMYC